MIRFSHFFIDRPIFATVLSLIIMISGLIAQRTLPIAEYPDIAPPTVNITATYPGAAARVIAETVATPIEQEVNGVDNMLYINSQSTGDGRLSVNVVFKPGTNIDQAQVLVQNRVAVAEPRLPEDVRRLGIAVRKASPDLMMVVHMTSPDGSRDQQYVSNYATLYVKDVLGRIDGVGNVNIFGARDYSMRVWLDPATVAARDLTAGEVVNAIRAANLQVAAGAVNQAPATSPGAFTFSVQTLGRLSAPEEFGNIVIKADPDGSVTRVRDIARVEIGSQDYTVNAYLNNKIATALVIFQRPVSNALATAAAVKSEMERLARDFPPGVGYSVVYNPTEFIQASVDAVVHTLGEAILLVVVVVILFLQTWRAAIIPIVAIPVSLVGTFFIMTAFGFSLNNLTLFGLVLAVGIVVDDAIVVVENVERNMALGMSPKEAAHRTMDEVSGALVAIALTLCAVFVPSAFISGISGLFFKQFATTIAASTVISCFVSLTLSPALCAVLLKPHKMGDAHDKPVGLARLLHPIFSRFNAAFEWLSSSYGGITGRFVRATVVIALVYVGLISLTGFQFSKMSTGFIPEQDIGYLAALVKLPSGSSLTRTDAVVREVNDILLKTPGVEHTSVTAGFDVTTGTFSSDTGTLYFALPSLYKKHIPGGDAATMLQTARQRLSGVKDAYVAVIMPPPVQGLGSAGGY